MATAMRQSATTVFYVWVFYLPMAVLGIPVEVFVPVSFASLFYQFWVHTTLVPKLGWYDRVFVSPSNHRVHHGQNGYAIDVNYGATLILWDRLFGTYAEGQLRGPGAHRRGHTAHGRLEEPADEALRPAGVGSRGKDDSENRVLALRFQALRDADRPLAAPLCVRRFEMPIGRWQRRYALFSYVMVTALFTHFLTIAYGMPMDERLAYGGLLVFSTMCTGWVLEGKRWGVLLELFRGITVAGALLAGLWFSPVTATFQGIAAACLAVMLALYALMWREGVALTATAEPAISR
jgi:hypothetical protein